MTLIEAVVATAVVLVVVIAASNAVAAVDQATVRTGSRDAAEAGVSAELEELRSLPFAGAGGAGESDGVSSGFPHADPSRNTTDASYAAEARAGSPAGTFTTIKQISCGPLIIAATFIAGTAAGFVPVGVTRLSGYSAGQALALPAATLLVQVSASWRSGTRAGLATRRAIIADRPGGLCRLISPSSAAS